MSSERPFPISKDNLDTVNSLSWFLMDAAWMLQFPKVSLALVFPTVISAICLCYIERRRNLVFINFAILSWIGMNVSWMLSDLLTSEHYLTLAKACFAVGIGMVVGAVLSSKNIPETFSHFKRFRIKSILR